ncbi:MAG: SsrA-binding protein SmpB [bacterium]|nr:SsrA-binding protein SmpB [bacterium]
MTVKTPLWASKVRDMADGTKTICVNRKARYDYHLLERFEAGLVLTGTEVKSLRAGQANIKDAYAGIEEGEIWLIGLHISPYDQGSTHAHDPERRRKLLLNAREVKRLITKIRDKGCTLVPTKMYFKGGWAKIEIALAQGKRKYDKRQAIAERDAARSLARARRGDRE